jgi:hypothetical protein
VRYIQRENEAVKPARRDSGSLKVERAVMRELLLSNDAVMMSFAQAVLREAEIESFVADQHMSIIEGSIGAFPRRLLVDADVLSMARRLLGEAGLGEWLVREDT